MGRYLWVIIPLFFCQSALAEQDWDETPQITGAISVKSTNTAATTVADMEQAILRRGLTLVAKIDHAANAASIGERLRPTVLFIFGRPQVGTPLMQCEQSVGLDLPQKMLVWEDEEGEVWVTYNSARYLKKRHKARGCREAFKKVAAALQAIATEAAN